MRVSIMIIVLVSLLAANFVLSILESNSVTSAIMGWLGLFGVTAWPGALFALIYFCFTRIRRKISVRTSLKVSLIFGAIQIVLTQLLFTVVLVYGEVTQAHVMGIGILLLGLWLVLFIVPPLPILFLVQRRILSSDRIQASTDR